MGFTSFYKGLTTSHFLLMTKELQQHLQQELSEVVKKEIVILTVSQVYGGNSNQTYLAETNAGKFFIKTNDISFARIFQKEYDGLEILRQRSILKIPEPVHYNVFKNTLYIVIDYLEKGKPTAQTWQQLGNGMAALHRQTGAQFGLQHDNFIGTLPQRNHPANTWAEFYTTQRILPMAQKAFDAHLFTRDDIKQAEALCNQLHRLFPEEPPALLHGDLWNGNVMACANGDAALFDPAVYYGNREMDIAMTLLFGGFDSLFYHHYNEAYPLQSGWQQRTALCQLYPLLVHLNLFGSRYYEKTKNVLKKYK